MMRGRPFGSMRVLPSGRVQVRYYGPDGLRHKAPMTFGTRTEARRWLSMMEADLARGRWDGDDSDGEQLATYADRWITERPGLSERSIALYRGLLRLHIAPQLGDVGLRKITPAMVRTWRQDLLDSGLGASTVSKAYRLLRAVLNTAADDELIRRNPCRIKGAGVEHPGERPVLTLSEVMTLADSIDRRYRMLVLLAVFASLRWGELMGLRKTDFDLTLGVVQVERAVSSVGARQLIKEPKTPAGVRTLALPMWPATRTRRALRGLLRADTGRPGVRRTQRCHAGPGELLLDLGSGAGEGWHDRSSLPRPAARRQPLRRGLGSVDARADGPDGARQRERCPGLPAPDGQPGSGDCRLARRHGDRAQGRGFRRFGARWGHGDGIATSFDYRPSRRT
jgi:hypothetical protein